MSYRKLSGAFSALLVLAALILVPSALGTTYKVLHAFSDTPDGAGLFGRLAVDAMGNVYGATSGGGAYGRGTVFELSPIGGGQWNETILHNFCADYPQCSDGGGPMKGVTLDAAGNLYGTTLSIFQLTPGPAGWDFSVIYPEGANGDLLTDQSRNLYLEWGLGGICSGGEIAKLKAPKDGNNWVARDLFDFCTDQPPDWPKGKDPIYGLSWDTFGNLYGVTKFGGANNMGLVFQLERTPNGWKEHVLHSFAHGRDGFLPYGGVVVDSAGNVYGSTLQGGSYRCGGPGCGTIYKVSKQPDAHWKETILYRFPKPDDGALPSGTLAIDGAGSLYGVAGGSSKDCSCGVVFKLAHNPDDRWTYYVLHRFHGTDGAWPVAGVILDAKGNIYGTTTTGGAGGYGVVFKIKP